MEKHFNQLMDISFVSIVSAFMTKHVNNNKAFSNYKTDHSYRPHLPHVNRCIWQDLVVFRVIGLCRSKDIY